MSKNTRDQRKRPRRLPNQVLSRFVRMADPKFIKSFQTRAQRPGTPYRHIIRCVTIDGVDYELHARKGWRRRPREAALSGV